uniref:Thioredoxin-like fold domain-containing protein n=1 Tax=Arion vulgaris TaxID=1028688 RepID=A0A0B7AI53_9EUPU
MFPLPYHQNSFYASRAAFVIHYLTNGTKTFQWIERILLEKLPDLTDSSFYNKSDVDLLNLFEEYVSDMGVDVATFRDMVDRRNSNQFERYTRIMWKYACSRGVAGTPTYIVNGIVHPNIEQSWGLNEWKLFINPLLQPQLFDDIDYLEINQPEE